MNRSILSDLDSVLSCPICLMHFDENERAPISLDCKHILCQICSMTILINNQIKCSLCRRITTIRDIESSAKKSYEYLYKEILDLYNDHTIRIQYPNLNGDQVNQNIKTGNFFSNMYDKISCIFKKQPMRVAFLGKSKVGKSTLINTLRGKFKYINIESNIVETSNDMAQTDVIRSTETIKSYSLFIEPNCCDGSSSNSEKTEIILCDIPSVGTFDLKQNTEYLKAIKVNTYDFFVLIFNQGFTETDEWLLKMVINSKKPFVFVYTKLDQTIQGELESWQNYRRMNEVTKMYHQDLIIKKIRNECVYNIHKTIELNQDFKLFLLSGLISKTDEHDYSIFNQFIKEEIPKLNKEKSSLGFKLNKKFNENSCNAM
jgi:ribosome biogenesis GTPase A